MYVPSIHAYIYMHTHIYINKYMCCFKHHTKYFATHSAIAPMLTEPENHASMPEGW